MHVHVHLCVRVLCCVNCVVCLCICTSLRVWVWMWVWVWVCMSMYISIEAVKTTYVHTSDSQEMLETHNIIRSSACGNLQLALHKLYVDH